MTSPSRSRLIGKKDPRSARVEYTAPVKPPAAQEVADKAKGSPEGLIKDLKKVDKGRKKAVGWLARVFGG